ncbi:hypothetical protein HWV62_2796 [Athelia sp. TMB]|nr:hypothetical protein HWV62_2796 [Athelia sp. TMB]
MSTFDEFPSELHTPSASESDVDQDVGVGLSDPHVAQSRRRMLDLVNRLHSTGKSSFSVQIDMDLPQIAVIGVQSAGKSSLIESISGITLPRAAGTCTRCPTECRLAYSNEPWKCNVYLRFITSPNGQPLDQVRNEAFGPTMLDKREVEERIRRAQRAILNPSTPAKEFLHGEDVDPPERQLTFSSNCVSLQISGKDVADLSFCDLPGLISSVGKGGNANDIELVKSLVTSYISKPSCIILSTVACETDFENQGAHHLAKLNDPTGKRTIGMSVTSSFDLHSDLQCLIGVLTKPDRIPHGEEDRWLKYIRNDSEALDNGWFCVKQPSSKSLSAGISWKEARGEENEWFSLTEPWMSLESNCQSHLRTENLTERLSVILSELIAKRPVSLLPEIHEELQKHLRNTEVLIQALPKPPSEDPFSEVLHLIGAFTRSLSHHLEGTPASDGLIQSIRPMQIQFQRAIRATAPDFRPYERSEAHIRSLPEASFLENEEHFEARLEDNGKEIFIDEVFDRAQFARTRELPDNYPFVVQKGYILDVIKQWREPSLNLFDAVQRTLSGHLKKLIREHFGHFGRGGLQQLVQVVLTEHLNKCGDRTKAQLNWLLEIESRPYTLNTHYYSDYKDKFLAFYRGSRQSGSSGDLIRNLQSYDPTRPHESTSFQESIAQIISALPKVGITGTQAADLAKLLAPDPMEPALAIIAGVRAYFQVAYKRFTDNIPLAIDQEFVKGVERDIEEVLYSGLKLSGPDGHKIAQELVQEPSTIAAQRDQLQKKLARLNTAREELLHVGI